MQNKSEPSFAKKLLFGLLISGFFFGATELVLRLLGFQFKPEYSNAREALWARLGVQQDRTLSWSWTPIPNGICRINQQPDISFNKLGYRGPVVSKNKPSNSLRIICMGDSCTMGWGVDDDETYCFLTSRLLSEKFTRNVETVNAGVLGYATSQGLHQLQERLLDLEPDLIIVSYNWNDHAPAIVLEHSEKGVVSARSDRELPGKNALSGTAIHVSRLRTFQLVQKIITPVMEPKETDLEEKEKPGEEERVLGPDEIPAVIRVPLEDYKVNLRKIIEIVKQHNVIPVLMTQPFNPTKLSNKRKIFFEQKQKEYNAALIEVARENNAPYLDMTPVFEANQPPLFKSRVHPTAKGHLLIAEELSRLIIKLPEWQKYRTGSKETSQSAVITR